MTPHERAHALIASWLEVPAWRLAVLVVLGRDGDRSMQTDIERVIADAETAARHKALDEAAQYVEGKVRISHGWRAGFAYPMSTGTLEAKEIAAVIRALKEEKP